MKFAVGETVIFFFFSSRRRHTRCSRDWSSDVCSSDLIASSKDGTVKIFEGTSLKLLKTVDYGDDADNLRYDAARQRVYVGYGSGGLGELDIEGKKIGEIKLDSHPESFQLEKNSPRIYVNLPKSRKIAVLNRETGTVLTTWGTGMSLNNYAMALDEANHRLFVVTRLPARLLAIDTRSEEHTSELQSRLHLVCRLLLEKTETSASKRQLLTRVSPPTNDHRSATGSSSASQACALPIAATALAPFRTMSGPASSRSPSNR